MRYLITALVLVAGCKGDKGDTGAEGPQGLQGMMGAMGLPGKDGKDAPPTKQLHLTVAKTGEDLGYFIGGTCALNSTVNAYVCFTPQGNISFANAGCTGTAYPSFSASYSGRLYIGPMGHVFSYMTTAQQQVTTISDWDGTKCTDRNAIVGMATGIMPDTGMVLTPHDITELTIELR